ncbi:MAG: DnaJ domain-containing protein [Stenomitos rutilans HA7619-LM2]|nr:DnaJ domain-containing protein [Stenomitos rutilans HA7619-LM2]MBW4469348.1 DnaJ domain-containing protein [Stenomitos rutilans HA7619-LM2]
MTFEEAINLLALESPFTLIQLKDAYRRMIRQWHPDLNPQRLQKATEVAQDLNAAYDLLEAVASVEADNGQKWSDYLAQKLPRWEREFKQGWQGAYHRTCLSDAFPGLHLHTFIHTFRRSRIEPRPEWFRGVLFADRGNDRTHYREHLLKIAPNRTMREEWARKYFTLEFGESSWVFYLPSSRFELTAGVTR